MRELLYPSLSVGCVGAWCPSRDTSRSTLLLDRSGNGKHGTLTNMDTGTDWVASGSGVALDFDGSNDYVTVPTISIASEITISLWCNLRSLAGAVLVEKMPTNGQWMLLYEGTLKLRGGTENPTLSVATGTTNTWMHVAATITGTVGTIYMNGTQVATGTVSAIGNGTGVINIGRYGDFGGGYYANGQFDDMRLYARSMQAGEIKTLAQRRGIAYETKRLARGRVATAAASRRNNMLVGCGF